MYMNLLTLRSHKSSIEKLVILSSQALHSHKLISYKNTCKGCSQDYAITSCNKCHWRKAVSTARTKTLVRLKINQELFDNVSVLNKQAEPFLTNFFWGGGANDEKGSNIR